MYSYIYSCMCNSMCVCVCIYIYCKRKIDHILDSCLSGNTFKKLVFFSPLKWVALWDNYCSIPREGLD